MDDISILKEKYDYFAQNPTDAENFMQYIYGIILDKGDHCIDVGANHGLHTVALSSFVGGGGGIVYAFEPIPKLYEQLTLLYQNNKIAYNNVQVFNIALTNHVKSKNSSVCFHHVPASDGFSGIMLRPDIENLKLKFDKIYVRCDALDNIISNNAIIKFIKIDTEGGDFDVLRGSERILATSNPVVVFESGRQFAADMYGYTKSDFFQFFKRLDYELFLYTGKKYTEDMWDSPYFYWETWAVSRKSQYYKFFSEKYGDLVLRFVKNQKALPGHTDYEYKNKYEAVMRSKSMRITAPLRKIMGYIRKTK